MSQISRTFTFSDGTVAYGSQVDSEIQNIVSAWNSHDTGVSSWGAVKSAGDVTIAVNYGVVCTTPDGAHTYRLRIDNAGNPTTDPLT